MSTFMRIKTCRICNFRFVARAPRSCTCPRCIKVFGGSKTHKIDMAMKFVYNDDTFKLRKLYHDSWLKLSRTDKLNVPEFLHIPAACNHITKAMRDECAKSAEAGRIVAERKARKNNPVFETCLFCGNKFRYVVSGCVSRRKLVCPICKYVLTLDKHSEYLNKLVRSYEKGICTIESIERDYAKLYPNVTPDIRMYIPSTLMGKLPVKERDPRKFVSMESFSRSVVLEELDNKRAEETLRKSIEEAELKTFRCKRCVSVVRRKDVGDELCDECRRQMEYANTKWFKGIVGLPEKPFEYIAKLPDFAREQYSKHMTADEKVELSQLIRENRMTYSRATPFKAPDIDDN